MVLSLLTIPVGSKVTDDASELLNRGGATVFLIYLCWVCTRVYDRGKYTRIVIPYVYNFIQTNMLCGVHKEQRTFDKLLRSKPSSLGWLFSDVWQQSSTVYSVPGLQGVSSDCVLFTMAFVDWSMLGQSLRCGRCPDCRPRWSSANSENVAAPPSRKTLTVIRSLFSRSPVLSVELLPPAGLLSHVSTSFSCSGTKPSPEDTCSRQFPVHTHVSFHTLTRQRSSAVDPCLCFRCFHCLSLCVSELLAEYPTNECVALMWYLKLDGLHSQHNTVCVTSHDCSVLRSLVQREGRLWFLLPVSVECAARNGQRRSRRGSYVKIIFKITRVFLHVTRLILTID